MSNYLFNAPFIGFINTLSHLYESILKEMRDASGDAGEFYTPRPVVKFMVEMLDPKIGETVLDPAAGTGGFSVAAFEHLKKQAKTVEQQEILQNSSIIVGEAKPLPYLLCQMNLLLLFIILLCRTNLPHNSENIYPVHAPRVKINTLPSDIII